MNHPRIYLTGFMGAGKTTVGRVLADKLGCEFTDVDELIVGVSGQSIPEIFRLQGEKEFRRLETEALKTCARKEGVFGLGGGAIISSFNRELLMSTGMVVYLRAQRDTLLERLQREADGRPMLNGGETLAERVGNLLRERSPLYELAHTIIDTDRLTPDQVASRLQMIVECSRE